LEASYCPAAPTAYKSKSSLFVPGSAAIVMLILNAAAPAVGAGAAAGIGLVFPTQLGRLEANYCWVLTSQEHDRLRRGFSFGFAANMGL
jgi:hypothetical protein